jgi:hypothetical protein
MEGAATYIPLFNGTTLTTSIVTQQTINVNSTALTLTDNHNLFFEVGALLIFGTKWW